jgi:hypothetical protein
MTCFTFYRKTIALSSGVHVKTMVCSFLSVTYMVMIHAIELGNFVVPKRSRRKCTRYLKETRKTEVYIYSPFLRSFRWLLVSNSNTVLIKYR